MATFTIADADLSNAITQAGFVLNAMNAYEANPNFIHKQAFHNQMNAMALIAAFAIKDANGNPLSSATFYGNDGGNPITSTTPQSGGIAKNP